MLDIDKIIKLAADPPAGTAEGTEQQNVAQPANTGQQQSAPLDTEQLKAEIQQAISASDELIAALSGGEQTEQSGGEIPEQETGQEPGNKSVVINVNVPGNAQVKTASEYLALEDLSLLMG